MSNTHALMDLVFPLLRQRVLALLLPDPAQAFHLREISRQTQSHPGTLARELDKLAAAGLLKRTDLGNQARYQADTAHPLYPEFASIFRKTYGFVHLLQAALAPLGPQIALALVYGSMASGTATAGSDVDVLVVGDADFADLARALYPLHEALGREVNPTLYTAAEFAHRVNRGDAFVHHVLGKPVVWIKGENDDIAKLAGNSTPAKARGHAGRRAKAARSRKA